jgi:hypothetical protein
MKVIGITLDEVLRDFLGHLSYAVAKIREEDEYVVTEGEVTEFDLVKYFKFKSKEEMYDLFYKEASLEIFGHPDQLHDGLFGKLNTFHSDIMDEEEDIEFLLITREAGRAIPATMFFLSKGCQIPNLKFIKEYADVWNHVDVLITATPQMLDTKPEGKTSVKIKSSYNNKSESDFEFDSIVDIINDHAKFWNIIKLKDQ